ncbi:G-type lectin S-receptor-like serine/threonine-protein kinase SD2-2 [Cryptomeria japonica]|uniref:G-type lectin S-receptor-like serine/threonine-protein kinase SD2-2 n=1 Tax=Cryptomeria japonica TaxID=3369 RepID=UPI0027DA4BE0|nr:G-type lectin S-receptor-like serine/threonine-protein kinase SD2-2 [Cryptomeria japonica]
MVWFLKDHCLKRFILALAVLILQGSCNLFVDGGDSLSLGASLRGKQTITSKNGTFALGFFNPNGTNNWYVGIWYAQIPDKTIVWVANRETPITDMPGVFTLSSTGAQNISEIVWESFANPTDTVLPTVKFWKGLKVNSWKSSMDPAPGPFFAQINPSPGKTDVLLQYKNGVSYYSTGEWNGSYFATLPGSPASSIVKVEFKVFSSTRMYYSFKVAPQADAACMVCAALMECVPPKKSVSLADVRKASTQEMLLPGVLRSGGQAVVFGVLHYNALPSVDTQNCHV